MLPSSFDNGGPGRGSGGSGRRRSPFPARDEPEPVARPVFPLASATALGTRVVLRVRRALAARPAPCRVPGCGAVAARACGSHPDCRHASRGTRPGFPLDAAYGDRPARKPARARARSARPTREPAPRRPERSRRRGRRLPARGNMPQGFLLRCERDGTCFRSRSRTEHAAPGAPSPRREPAPWRTKSPQAGCHGGRGAWLRTSGMERSCRIR